MAEKSVHKFMCNKCKFIYDPRKGGGIAPPDTAFEYLPANWCCPSCTAGQTDFIKKYEVVEIKV